MMLQKQTRFGAGIRKSANLRPAALPLSRPQQRYASAMQQWSIARPVLGAAPLAPKRLTRAQATSTSLLPALPGTARVTSVGGPVVVYGAQGLLGIALVKALLESGQKVVAGVENMDAAQATLAFAKKYELLTKKALDNLQLRETQPGNATGLPKGGKFIIVEGDSVANNRTDTRFVQGGLATAEAAGASKVVLVTSESSKSGTFFFFGGNNNTPNKDLTRTEKLVEASGIPAIIVRASTQDKASEVGGELRLVAGPGGLAPSAAPISKDQLGELMTAVLNAPAPPAGAAAVVEAAQGPMGSGSPLRAVLGEALDRAQSKAPVPKQNITAPPQGSVIINPLAALGTVSMRKGRMVDAEAGDSPAPKPAGRQSTGTGTAGGLLGTIFGSSKVAAPAAGTTKKQAAPAKAPKAAVKAPPPPPKPAPKPVAKPPPPTPKPAPKPVAKAPPPAPVKKAAPPPPSKRAATPSKDDAKEAKQSSGGGGLLGFLGLGSKPKQVDDAPPAPKGTAKITTTKGTTKTSAVKVAPKKAPPPAKSGTTKRSAEPEEAPKKSGGLGALFGLGGGSSKKQQVESTGTSATRKVSSPPASATTKKVVAPPPASRATVKVGTTTTSKQAPKPAAKPPAKSGTTSSVTGRKGTFIPISGYGVPPKKK